MKPKYKPTKKRIYENNHYVITLLINTGAYKVSPKDSFNDSYFNTLDEAAKYIGTTSDNIMNADSYFTS
jgi:hypothetical protein